MSTVPKTILFDTRTREEFGKLPFFTRILTVYHYRRQLVSWDEYDAQIDTFCRQVGHTADPATFVQNIHAWLTSTIHSVDEAFPTNQTVSMQEGRPVMRKPIPHPIPEGFDSIEQCLTDRLGERNILDVLSDTEHWLHWTAPFGPISGFDARLNEPRLRYLATTFCYGCHLGPTQTARSMTGIDWRHLAYVNQMHVTEQKLLEANVQVINAYNRFILPKMWGTGQHASADGTKWDVYEQNLLSEYHIRYGGWGGIGYYHVSDTYIALFSSFISCGVWEAVHILDGLMENRSEIRPDTLHADTQGQSEPVFGLAYLLGIDLMPRIRHWQALKFYLPSSDTPVEHIHELFSDTIDLGLIQTLLPDMLRTALSISRGNLRASTILRKLGTYSRKNRLYLAFRELGRVVRTVYLLQLIGDEEMRRMISTATNTSESWNAFIQWIAFGGQGIIKANNREEQRKIIRYNHLVANLVIFYNVVTMTGVLRNLVDEGYPITPEILARLSPYKTEHVNRFGQYELRFDQMPQPITEDLILE